MSVKSFTFICGDDDYLVAQKGKSWFAEQTSDLCDELSKELVDARSSNVAEVDEVINRFSSAVQTLSLFGERKVIWLKDVNFLADSPTGRAQGTLSLLENLKEVLENLDAESVHVLITAQPVDKRRSFFKWCRKVSEYYEIQGGTDLAETCANLIKEICKDAGVIIIPEALDLLISKVNGNTRLLVEETSKLVTFVGRGREPINERLVADLVPNFGDTDFFEAADAFYSLKLKWTLDALRRHFFTNSESRPLLANLQSRNRLLIQLRVLLDARVIHLGARGITKNDLDAAARTYGHHFGDSTEKSNLNVFTQNPWYLGRLATTASKLSLKKLIDFQLAFSDAFEAILERPNQQEEVCRELAVRCLS